MKVLMPIFHLGYTNAGAAVGQINDNTVFSPKALSFSAMGSLSPAPA
jgi:hypothetical protein